jgi:hypothetical protein
MQKIDMFEVASERRLWSAMPHTSTDGMAFRLRMIYERYSSYTGRGDKEEAYSLFLCRAGCGGQVVRSCVHVDLESSLHVAHPQTESIIVGNDPATLVRCLRPWGLLCWEWTRALISIIQGFRSCIVHIVLPGSSLRYRSFMITTRARFSVQRSLPMNSLRITLRCVFCG